MPRRSLLPRTHWKDGATLALLIASTAWLSLTLARGPGELSALWVGNGILTGWLLSRRSVLWPGYLLVAFAAELPARMLAGDEGIYAAAIALCNLLEAGIVADIVRRAVPDVRDPRNWMRLGGLATGATLIACAVSGVLAANIAHILHGQPLFPALLRWFTAHVVGMVLVATTTLVVQRQGIGGFFVTARRLSLVLTLLLLAVVASGVFLIEYPVLFLAYPPLLLVAVRHRFLGVALGVITLGLVGAIATTLGFGPVADRELDVTERIALLQLYIAGGCLITIPVCLAMAERDRLAASLRESERRYRMLADHSHDAIVRIGADGKRVYISPSASAMVGRSLGELAGPHWDVVHPEDQERHRQRIAEVLATGQPSTDTYRLRHRDGRSIWVEAVILRIPADEGEGHDLLITARDIDQRVAAEQAREESLRELERQSRVDALTELPNRRQFDERLALALKRLQRHHVPMALLCLDLDRFKAINDTYGHAAGDEVLKAFARRLCASVRETDLVARLGGDEFVIVLEDVAPGGAEAVARKIIAAMAEPMEAAGHRLIVATSIGVACSAQPMDPALLMAQADAALYRAKNAGRNCYYVAE